MNSGRHQPTVLRRLKARAVAAADMEAYEQARLLEVVYRAEDLRDVALMASMVRAEGVSADEWAEILAEIVERCAQIQQIADREPRRLVRH